MAPCRSSIQCARTRSPVLMPDDATFTACRACGVGAVEFDQRPREGPSSGCPSSGVCCQRPRQHRSHAAHRHDFGELLVGHQVELGGRYEDPAVGPADAHDVVFRSAVKNEPSVETHRTGVVERQSQRRGKRWIGESLKAGLLWLVVTPSSRTGSGSRRDACSRRKGASMKLGLQPRILGAQPPSNHAELVAAAEEAGFDTVFTAEAWGPGRLHAAGLVGP